MSPAGTKPSGKMGAENPRMKNKSRRYEVLLPVRFNDGSDVLEELLGEAVNEIVDQSLYSVHSSIALCLPVVKWLLSVV